MKRVKAIGLLSGGLDSILAVKVLQEQEIELLGITFTTPFFDSEPGLAAGRAAGIPMLAPDIGEIHLEMLREPLYGYGSQMNPCIDCHALMLHQAGLLMEREGADFLFTGEVLGQRPMSQRRDSLRSVERLSGYAGRVLRPLSAKLLPPTIPETEGLVDRERLLDIQGRGRKRQVALAEHYGIREYPQPGGGCMLTKEGFARKLKEYLSRNRQATAREVKMLRYGRSLLLPGGSWCVVGRNREDNGNLDFLAGESDVVLRLRDHVGPTGLISGPTYAPEDLAPAAAILASYGDAPRGGAVDVVWTIGPETGVVTTHIAEKEEFEGYLVL